MSSLELALQKLKESGAQPPRPVDAEHRTDAPGLSADRCMVSSVLEPLAPSVATMRGTDDETMRIAWEPNGNSALLSQLRNIRREIEKLPNGGRTSNRSKLIVVTSAMPGDGKSFISTGLARAYAATQEGRVVLVDADLPKRHLTELTNTADQSGLSECLAEGRALSDVLCRTDHAAMSFLPAGRWRPEIADLLCSSKMDRILDSLRHCEGPRVFVIDTAPILAFGETAYLAERADLVVLTVRADLTPRAAVDEALRKLAADRPLALVLNGQQSSVLDAWYGYGDYYGDYAPRDTR